MIAPILGYGQGEQRYADGTATDQDGNTFEWINYGTQDWAIENAEVVTYSDGTAIPQVTDATEWSNLTTGAWCYYDNDSSKGKLYNWYAVAGIHNESSINNPSLRKEFAPNGWRVANDAEWTTLENYLISSGYNYDGTTTDNKIGKSMASTIRWDSSAEMGAIGNNLANNNKSGFNALPEGLRQQSGQFKESSYNQNACFWTFSENLQNSSNSWYRSLDNIGYKINTLNVNKLRGFSVRFVRDASTASTDKYSNVITIYPNPTTSIVTLQGDKQYDIEVYNLQGKKVMALRGNTIDMSHLSSATYIVKALDKVENEEVSYKVVKN